MNKSKNTKFNIKDASKVFFTSDTHFNHENIIGFCNRPFGSSDEMTERLIENWNRKVPEDGTVYHLGDFAFGGADVWKSVRERLNGDIVLIVGNHDIKNMPNSCRYLFKDITMQMHLVVEGRKLFLNHFPFLCYSGVYRTESDMVYQLFGHVHSGEGQTGKDMPRLQYLFPTQYDVGVDNNNYEPMSWKEVNDAISEQIKTSKQVG